MERIFVGHDCQTPAAWPGSLAQVEEGERCIVRIWILRVCGAVSGATRLAGRDPLVKLGDRRVRLLLLLLAQGRRA